MDDLTQTTKPYGVSYKGARHPHTVQTEWFDTLDEAFAAFTKAKLNERIGEPSLLGSHAVLESYATKDGLVLSRVKEPDGFYRTALWAFAADVFYAEQLLLTKDKRNSERQMMPAFAGMCAAGRAIKSLSAARSNQKAA